MSSLPPLDRIKRPQDAVEGEYNGLAINADQADGWRFPDGWKLVPIEPTDEMIEATRSVTASWLDIKGSGLTVAREKMRRRYRAAVAAAPPAPSAAAQQAAPPAQGDGWRPIETAPKTSTSDWRAITFEGWCPEDGAPDGGDIRIIWWEPKLKGGSWWSDRDLSESPTLWRALRPAPSAAPSAPDQDQDGGLPAKDLGGGLPAQDQEGGR